MNNDYKRKRDEILDQVYTEAKADVLTEEYGFIMAEAEKAMDKLVLETVNSVIGEDETVTYEDMEGILVGEVKNTSRDANELRQKAKELINPGEGEIDV